MENLTKQNKESLDDIFEASFLNDLSLEQWLKKEASSETFKHNFHNTVNEAHLNHDMLIRYHQNELNHTEKKQIMKHLALCPKCSKRSYQIIQEQSNVLQQMYYKIPLLLIKRYFSLPVYIFIVALALFSLTVFMPAMIKYVFVAFIIFSSLTFVMMKQKKQRQFVSVFNLMLMCCMAYQILGQSSIQDSIHETYQWAQTINTKKTNPIKFQWEIGRYAFANLSANQPFHLAFGAGLWKGRNILQKSEKKAEMPHFLTPQEPTIQSSDWNNTNYSQYFELGEWCFLLKYMCLNQQLIDQSFIDQQKTIVAQFSQDTTFDKETQTTLKSLSDAMQENRIIAKNSVQKNQRFCINVQYRLKCLEKALSPKL